MTRRRWVIVCLGGLAGLAFPAASARADGTITVVYAGTLDGTFVYQPSNPSVWQAHRQLKWKETTKYAVKASGPQDVQIARASSSVEVSGKVSATYAPPNDAMTCTGTIHLRPGFDDARFEFPTLGFNDQFQASGLAPATNAYIASTGKGDCAGPDGTNILGPVENEPQTSGSDWVTPELRALSNAPKTSKPFDVDYRSPDGQSHLVVRATLSVTNTGGRAPAPQGPPTGPDIPADKRAAFNDLGPAITYAEAPCLQQGTGLVLLGAGGLLLGTGPVFGPGLVISGSLTAAVLAPLCAEAIKRVVSDYRRYKDPPFRTIHTVAKPGAISRKIPLPSCARRKRSVRAYCAALRARYAAMLLDARRVSVIDHALEITIGRQTASVTAHDRAAFKLQAATAKRLERQMTKALRTQAAAGASARALLLRHHLRLRISRGRSAKVIGAVVRLVGRRGISRKKLAAPAPSALAPHTIDVFRAFAHPR